MDGPEVRGEHPALRFEGGTVFVSDEAEPADLSASVVVKLSPVTFRIAVFP